MKVRLRVSKRWFVDYRCPRAVWRLKRKFECRKVL